MHKHRLNKPSAEDVIPDYFVGDMMEDAMRFAVYMREINMPFQIHTTARQTQSAKYKGKTICLLYVYSAADKNFVLPSMTGSQTLIIVPYIEHLNIYENTIIKDGLHKLVLDSMYYCVWGENSELSGKERGCNPQKGCAGGKAITRFGKSLADVCMSRTNPFIRNPGEKEIEAIKRLLELEKQARDNLL